MSGPDTLPLILRCIAEQDEAGWTGLCVDLDLAVQGASFEEVADDLRTAIEEYLAHVRTLPEPDRTRLLNRKAPWSLRAKYVLYQIQGAWHRRLPPHHASFGIPFPAKSMGMA